jgi:hypothetical protein
MLARSLMLFLVLLATGLPAHAGGLLDLEIINRATGEVLTPYRHTGQDFVAGNPGDRYAVRLRNRTGQRLLVVLSVDGVNAVTGETAAPDQSGYVLDPWSRIEIAGWRKSLREVAQFYFTALPDAYAVRTGRPENVGVIGAAVFREKVRLPQPATSYLEEPSAGARAEGRADDAAAPAAKAMLQEAQRLGTGHGPREYAPTQYTDFERAGVSPDEVLSVRYDSRANLIAQGVIRKPRPPRPFRHEPRPFPGQFVPDPQG